MESNVHPEKKKKRKHSDGDKGAEVQQKIKRKPAQAAAKPPTKPNLNPNTAPLTVLDAKGRRQYPFGNYSRYYGYRSAERFSDGRLDVLPHDVLKDKVCLDIGCNSGEFTIAVGKLTLCLSSHLTEQRRNSTQKQWRASILIRH